MVEEDIISPEVNGLLAMNFPASKLG